jgi:hypothetical protein
MDEIRTIVISRRGCGKRKEGHIYIVSEPSPDGVLPMWTPIDPPIPYINDDGTPAGQFRGFISVDLDAILQRHPMSEYLAGASKIRLESKILHDPEIERYGMIQSARLRTGICKKGGIEALENLRPLHAQTVFVFLRSLMRKAKGNIATEPPKAIQCLQSYDCAGALAALWRMWNKATDKQKVQIKPDIAGAMTYLGAREDAIEL